MEKLGEKERSRGSKVSVVGCAGLLFVLASLAQAPASGIQGVIVDTEGASIAHARILVHWDPSGSAVGLQTNVGIKHDAEVETGNDGRFKIDVPAGFYDLFVTAGAFSPHAEKVRVMSGSIIKVKAILRADVIVTRELGDRFPTH